MEKIKLFKKADLILIAVLVFICAMLFAPRLFDDTNKAYAYIYIDGEETDRIALSEVSESYEIALDCEPSLTVLVEQGRICVENADCTDKICMKCGWLKRNNDTATCLPANVVIVVRGASRGEPDAMTY